MGLVVQKYGGSSVADAASVQRVARRITDTVAAGDDVAVVVSAMGDTTDDLIQLAHQVSPQPPARELDMLLTAGERISMAVLAMAISDLGYQARSYTGSQAGLITDAVHGRAKIVDVTPKRIEDAIADGFIPIVAGFQGVSRATKDVTTLGRGGSDTTAVAVAAALGATRCEIYTDVDGVFTADPRVVARARQLRVLSYEETLELAAYGAKVLHIRSVEYARRCAIPLVVRSSFSSNSGTLITTAAERDRILAGLGEASSMEQAIISGVAHDMSVAKITIIGVPDKLGEAAAIFETLASAGVNLDMIVQNVSADGRTDITFTLPMDDGARAMSALEQRRDDIGFKSLRYDDEIGVVSVVGAGMRTNHGVSATTFRALADAGVNVEMISTSEIRISVVTRARDTLTAVRAIHTAFDLDGDGQAQVYAGTGR